jgi:hypothetical protein
MEGTLANALEEEVKVVGGLVADVRVDEIVKMLTVGIVNKPTTVSEALTLLEHLALKHIEPLIDTLRAWALSEVPEGERKMAEIALKSAEMTAEKKE